MDHAFLALLLLLLPATAKAQVQNLRYYDADMNAGYLGGTISWEKSADGDVGVVAYSVFLAESSSGLGQQQLGSDVMAGNDISEIVVPTNTLKGSFTSILVYLKNPQGSNYRSASICLLDNPTANSRTFYVTVSGHSNAISGRAALVQGCHAQDHDIQVNMVATMVWSSSAIVETDFDHVNEQSSTANFLIVFPSGSSSSDIGTAVLSSPVSMAFTGSGADASYSLGALQVYSTLDEHVPIRPDPDIGRHLARSCMELNLASAATITMLGEVRLFTKVSSQTALQSLANIWAGKTISFENLGATSAVLTTIGAKATATIAQCSDISGDPNQGSCTSFA